MPKWGDERARLERLLKSPIPEDEPCTRLCFPRRDAKKRIKNTEGRKRIVFPADPVTYSEFHAQKERLIRENFGDNPVLFGIFLTDMLKGSSYAIAERWKAIHEGAGNAEGSTDEAQSGL